MTKFYPHPKPLPHAEPLMEMPSLEEEAAMSLYGDYEESYGREPDNSGDWSNEPQDWYPGDDDEDEEEYQVQSARNYAESIDNLADDYDDMNEYDEPPVIPWDVENPEGEDDPVETDDPDDMRGWN